MDLRVSLRLLSAVLVLCLAATFAYADGGEGDTASIDYIPRVERPATADPIDGSQRRVTAPILGSRPRYMGASREHNGRLASRELAVMEQNVSCSRWAVVAISVNAEPDKQTGIWQLQRPMDTTAGGWTVNYFESAPLSEKLCSKLKGPHQHSFGGWRMLDAGDIEPAIVLYLAKFQEYRFRYTVQEAEAEIAAAAQKCASSGLPWDDLGDWPPCLFKHGVTTGNSKVGYFGMSLPKPAFTLAAEVPDGFPLGVHTVTVKNEDNNMLLTFVTLPQ